MSIVVDERLDTIRVKVVEAGKKLLLGILNVGKANYAGSISVGRTFAPVPLAAA